MQCVYFDQTKPAGRGYGYVGVSRFMSRTRFWLYGKLRRTEFLPVGEAKESEVLQRGYASEDSGDDCARGVEYAFGGHSSDVDSEYADDCAEGTCSGNNLADFL